MFYASSGQIMITAGDTGIMGVHGKESGYQLTENDRVIFTARDKPGGRKLIEKVIQPNGEGVARIPFMTEDTADLKPKGYVWDIRVALEAEVDGNGDVTGYRELVTPMLGGVMSILPAIGGTK